GIWRHLMCGIFGIANHADAAGMTYLGLYALQHRGQESTGISSSDGDQVYTHKSMGYVADVFSEDVITKLKGLNAIGHTRYSTAGDSNEGNAQPIVVKCTHGTVALVHNGNLINAVSLREVEPGEIVLIRGGEMKSVKALTAPKLSKCIFEHVYFSRPDSIVFGRTVQTSRDLMGRILAEECPVDADLVVPVPDSGVTAAIGYSQRSGIPFAFGLIRNHYVGRTFIEPKTKI